MISSFPLNAQVGTVLLGCAFLYDIFWVFISKLWFHKSVMIVVSTHLTPKIKPIQQRILLSVKVLMLPSS